jgi:hypothetical protein
MTLVALATMMLAACDGASGCDEARRVDSSHTSRLLQPVFGTSSKDFQALRPSSMP